MLKKQAKTKVIKDSQKHKEDTGSAEVQISILSERIFRLSDHLKKNKQDNHSRRGLLKMVAHRKKMVNYLKKDNLTVLEKLSKKYGFKF
jgi:small subunit ribosomal protein S15